MSALRKNYREILKQELLLRKKFNPKYSLRGFARYLGLSPHRLSQVLNGKHGLSRKAADGVAKRLGFTSEQADYFCDLVESEHARSPVARAKAVERIQKLRTAATIWPKQTPAFQITSTQEIALWGLADPAAVEKHWTRREGVTPYRDPEYGGAIKVCLAIRIGTGTGEQIVSHEFWALVLVADLLSTTGYSILPFNHLTDSVQVIESRRKIFGSGPKLTGRIRADILTPNATGSVEDEAGETFFSFVATGTGRIRRESNEKFSLIRNCVLPDGRIGKARVVGVSHFRDKKFDPRRDSFRLRPRSKLSELFGKIHFRPTAWRLYRSTYDFHPIQGGADA